VRECSGGEI